MRVALGLLVALLVSGCAAQVEPDEWISAAAEAHERADKGLSAAEWDFARFSLIRVVESRAPAGLAAEDERAVRQDTLFRLSEIELLQGRAEGALEWANQGLDLGDGNDLFAANLHISRGRALERLGQELEAAQAYHRALKINEQLLARVLGDSQGRSE